MMPLTFAGLNEDHIIQSINGNTETKRFLEKLGFIQGTKVSVVSSINGNVIVNIKDSRIAIDAQMARHIMV